jgi:hypothetical protein
MAKETKTIEVGPDYADNVVNTWALFGWELHSRQTIKNKSSKLENRGGDIYQVTESEHYVELTFQRESTIPHYTELAALQNQFDAVPGPGNRSNLFSKLSLIVLGLGLLITIGGFTQLGYGISMFSLGYIFFGIVIIFLKVFFHIRKNKKWDAAYVVYKQERDKILEQARAFGN